MITYDKLNQKPRAFRSITGMGITEFDELFRKSIPLWTRLERERLSRSDGKRAIGGGHPYAFQLRERLLMTAIWLRLYLSNEALGFFFGVDKSAASRTPDMYCHACVNWRIRHWAGQSFPSAEKAADHRERKRHHP